MEVLDGLAWSAGSVCRRCWVPTCDLLSDFHSPLYRREVSYSCSLSYRYQHIDTGNNLLFFRFSNHIAKQRLSYSDDRRCDRSRNR
jgi:hypothetical protein